MPIATLIRAVIKGANDLAVPKKAAVSRKPRVKAA